MRVAGYAKQLDAKHVKLLDNVTRDGYHKIGFFLDEDCVELLDIIFISKQKWAELEKLSEDDLLSLLLKMRTFRQLRAC